MRRLFTALAIAGLLFVSQHRAFAQPADGAQGTYAFATTGFAGLLNDANCAVHGLVPAGLTGGKIILNGHGGIAGSAGISIGVNNCTGVNYSLTGSYTIENRGEGTIEATGTMNLIPAGRLQNCTGTFLNAVPVTLIVTPGSFGVSPSLGIQTAGAASGSTYTESPPAGPASCTATIANFATSGTGNEVSNR